MEMRTTVSTFKPSPPPPLCTLLRGCSARMRSMSTTMTAPSRIRRLRMPRSVSCEASPALEPKAASKVSPPLTLVVPAPPSTQQYQVPEGEGEGEGEGGAGEGVTIIGARVRVKVPLKVYHVPRLAEVVELTGTEGRVKEYVGVSKGGINLSANLPFKVEFVYESKRGSGGLHKFTAHLKQDEFDYI